MAVGTHGRRRYMDATVEEQCVDQVDRGRARRRERVLDAKASHGVERPVVVQHGGRSAHRVELVTAQGRPGHALDRLLVVRRVVRVDGVDIHVLAREELLEHVLVLVEAAVGLEHL